MNFGVALDLLLKNAEHCTPAEIRRKSWGPGVLVGLVGPAKDGYMTAPYLYVMSDNGFVPWVPNMIEMCVADDWEVII